MINKLPDVGRVQGGLLEEPGGSREAQVLIQYTDRSNEWCELRMSLPDAMYLLNILKAIQQEAGYEMPDDPHAEK